MPTAHEHFSSQFYKWEKCGRGWQIFPQPVCPEPPFVPFQYRSMTEAPEADDGRRPTFLSSLFRKTASPPTPPPVLVEPEPDEEPEPIPLIRKSLVEFQASLPDKLDVSKEAFEQFLLNLSLCHEPIAFELLGTHKKVTAQFAAAPSDALLLRRQLQAFFPEAAFASHQNSLEIAWENASGGEMLAVEFGLEREFMFPLASGRLDPFIGIIGALSELEPGELGLFQVLWQPVQHPWAESIVSSVTHADGKPFFVNSPELAGAAENKVARPLYAAVVRIMVCADVFDRVVQLAKDLAGSLRVFAHPQGNALIPLRNDEYGLGEHIEDVLRRQTRRTGMLLNSDELVGFVHLPSSAVRSPAFARDTGRTKAAPDIVSQPGVVIGDNEHNGEIVPVRLTTDQRVRHTHIIGSSGTGKSSLLFNLIRQDIENGDGVAVLDPHGDLIQQILGIIPDHRIDDVVLVNPSDVDFPIGFNILQAHSDEEKNLLASDLIAVFRRLASSWGDQMDAVLQNAILAFLESKQGGTLADLRRFLLEPAFRSQFLQTVDDPEIIYYWQKVFPQLTGGKSIGPVLTRLQDFFSRKPLRNMVSQRDNKLDFRDIMDGGKIFLASLSEGLCGAENSYLLGTLLVSKFQQLAMARQSQAAASRKHFWLYIDEFDHFISPSMAEILKGARKYRLGLTLAHQELHQLKSDPKVESAVLTHPCTRIVFRVGDDDAKKLGEGFESFDAKSLKNLEKFHAIARVERNDFDFNLAVRKPDFETVSDVQAIIAKSRAKYATPRAEVEAALLTSLRGEVKKTTVPSSGAPSNFSPPAPPTGTAEAPLPPLPSPIIPPSAALPPIAEALKVATPPVAEIPKVTVSEKESVTDTKPVAAVPKDLGRGGAQHKAIQKRIKEAAEVLGFRSVIEKPVLDGQGSVDLWLERTGQSIACEISISTTIDHEVGNIRKCLKAGLPQVAIICVSEDRLQKIAAAVSGSLGAETAAQVAYYQPDQFIAHLKTLPVPVPKDEVTIRRGYKVKRTAPALTEAEQRQHEELANKIMAEAMRPKFRTPSKKNQ
jgi:hypothetical protein